MVLDGWTDGVRRLDGWTDRVGRLDGWMKEIYHNFPSFLSPFKKLFTPFFSLKEIGGNEGGFGVTTALALVRNDCLSMKELKD